MFLYLLLAFTLVPVFEIWLLIRIGGALGAGSTIALVLLTGVVGAALAKREGLRTLAKINESLARGVMPAREMVAGLVIFVAGVLLVTPGVVTDAVGFALLIPPLRAWFVRRLAAYFRSRMTIIGPDIGPQPEAQDDEVIDVAYREMTDAHTRPLDDSQRDADGRS